MLGSAGCGLLIRSSRAPGSVDLSSAQFSTNWASKTLTLVMLQAQVTRFADQYAASIAQATDDYATTVNTPEARLKALQWKLAFPVFKDFLLNPVFKKMGGRGHFLDSVPVSVSKNFEHAVRTSAHGPKHQVTTAP